MDELDRRIAAAQERLRKQVKAQIERQAAKAKRDQEDSDLELQDLVRSMKAKTEALEVAQAVQGARPRRNPLLAVVPAAALVFAVWSWKAAVAPPGRAMAVVHWGIIPVDGVQQHVSLIDGQHRCSTERIQGEDDSAWLERHTEAVNALLSTLPRN